MKADVIEDKRSSLAASNFDHLPLPLPLPLPLSFPFH